MIVSRDIPLNMTWTNPTPFLFSFKVVKPDLSKMEAEKKGKK
jgi:hypothetical protein